MSGNHQSARNGDPRKVVHLSSVHHYHDTRIFVKECASLRKAGFDVTLIIGRESDVVEDGIRVIAVPRTSNRLKRMLTVVPKLFLSALRARGDVYHFHDPELIPVGLLLKLLRKKVVYDVHEDVPGDIMAKYWIPPVLRSATARIAGAMESAGAYKFDAIVAVTDPIAKRFPANKTVVVQNYPYNEEYAAASEISYCDRMNDVLYVGSIMEIRGIREMVEAVDLLPRTLNARFTLGGRFAPPDLETEVRRMPGWRNVNYVGWQTREDYVRVLSQTRIGLVLFHPVPNHVESQPNKLFEYMRAGIPVVASNFSRWKEFVETVNCGLLVNPLDAQEIAEAIKWLLENVEEAAAMGGRGRQAVLELYNWESEAAKLISMYNQLLA